jgi:hypothetical protein
MLCLPQTVNTVCAKTKKKNPELEHP